MNRLLQQSGGITVFCDPSFYGMQFDLFVFNAIETRHRYETAADELFLSCGW